MIIPKTTLLEFDFVDVTWENLEFNWDYLELNWIYFDAQNEKPKG